MRAEVPEEDEEALVGVLLEFEVVDGEHEGVVELVLVDFDVGEVLLDGLLHVGDDCAFEGIILAGGWFCDAPVLARVIMTHFSNSNYTLSHPSPY